VFISTLAPPFLRRIGKSGMSPEESDALLKRLPAVEQLLLHLAREATAIRQTLDKQHLDRERIIRVEQETYYEHLLESSRYREPKRLHRYERQIFSQHGEDGIIEEIFHRIGAPSRTFLEIGVEDGKENNTAHLVQQGWHGVWIDGDQPALQRAAQEFAKPMQESRLKLIAAMVTAENIGRILSDNGVSRELDLMSLDIDRNTYFLWKALADYKARLVVRIGRWNTPPINSGTARAISGRASRRMRSWAASLATAWSAAKPAGPMPFSCAKIWPAIISQSHIRRRITTSRRDISWTAARVIRVGLGMGCERK
jgi:hypothetical protein